MNNSLETFGLFGYKEDARGIIKEYTPVGELSTQNPINNIKFSKEQILFYSIMENFIGTGNEWVTVLDTENNYSGFHFLIQYNDLFVKFRSLIFIDKQAEVLAKSEEIGKRKVLTKEDIKFISTEVAEQNRLVDLSYSLTKKIIEEYTNMWNIYKKAFRNGRPTTSSLESYLDTNLPKAASTNITNVSETTTIPAETTKEQETTEEQVSSGYYEHYEIFDCHIEPPQTFEEFAGNIIVKPFLSSVENINKINKDVENEEKWWQKEKEKAEKGYKDGSIDGGSMEYKRELIYQLYYEKNLFQIKKIYIMRWNNHPMPGTSKIDKYNFLQWFCFGDGCDEAKNNKLMKNYKEYIKSEQNSPKKYTADGDTEIFVINQATKDLFDEILKKQQKEEELEDTELDLGDVKKTVLAGTVISLSRLEVGQYYLMRVRIPTEEGYL